MLAGTRGGETRCRIIEFLQHHPSNAHSLSSALHLDYKTVRHHLAVLEKNNVIIQVNKGNYGAVYFLSEPLKEHLGIFHEIWVRFGKK